MMNAILDDFRYAFRGLLRTPGFTTAAVLTLALGIGANTVIFSIVDHVGLRPLAYQDPDRLFAVHEVVPRFANIAPLFPGSADHFLRWKQTTHPFEEMALVGNVNFNLTGSGEPEQLLGARVSASLFPMLGVRPQLGRTFLEEEDQPGRDHVVLLNDELWRRRFAADPQVIAQTIALNGEPYQVVGVLPATFRFPRLADLIDLSTQDGHPQIWKPFALRKDEVGGFGDFNYRCIVRLKRSVSVPQALAEINAIQAIIGKSAPPEPIELRATLVPLADQIAHRFKAGLEMLLAAVGIVLMIGCVNITNLVLARVTNRRKEIAIRSAMGASFSLGSPTSRLYDVGGVGEFEV
jgi:predicted permease